MISTDRLNELQKIIRASVRSAIFWWLMNVPYASINDLERLSGYSYQQIRSEFTRMRREQLAFCVKVGWHRRIQLRLGLARKGVHQASELFFDGAIPWPATEEGHKYLLDRLPVLEIINELAPTLRVQWLAQFNKHGSDESLASGLAIALGGLRLSQLHRVWQGRPVAVGRYNLGAQIPFVYVDRQANGRFVTEQDRLRFAGMSTADDDPAGRSLHPPHWVIICDGPIAEELARHRLYPDEPRIMVESAKGNWAAACPPSLSRVTGSPLMPFGGPTTLGCPERMIDWVKDDDSMLIYRDRLAGRLFSLAEDSRAAKPTDAARLWKLSGKEIKEAGGRRAVLRGPRRIAVDTIGSAGHRSPLGTAPPNGPEPVWDAGGRAAHHQKRTTPWPFFEPVKDEAGRSRPVPGAGRPIGFQSGGSSSSFS